MKRDTPWVILLSVLPTLLNLLSTTGETATHDQLLQMTGADHELCEEWVLDSILALHCRDDHYEFQAIYACWHHGYYEKSRT